MTRAEAISYIAKDLEYGFTNAEDWVMSAAFQDGWTHPAGVLVITWDAKSDSYMVEVTS